MSVSWGHGAGQGNHACGALRAASGLQVFMCSAPCSRSDGGIRGGGYGPKELWKETKAGPLGSYQNLYSRFSKALLLLFYLLCFCEKR